MVIRVPHRGDQLPVELLDPLVTGAVPLRNAGLADGLGVRHGRLEAGQRGFDDVDVEGAGQVAPDGRPHRRELGLPRRTNGVT